MDSKSRLVELIRGKKVLFVTTKNRDYIRNTQELKIIYEYAGEVEEVYSLKRNNPLRIIDVLMRLTRKKVERADIVFLGFEPQFVLPLKKSMLKGKTIIVDFFISVYDTLVWDRKRIKDRTMMAKFCHKIDEVTLLAADLIIADTKAHQTYFVEEFGGHDKLFETMYLEADADIYYPRVQNKPEELQDEFVVLYFGSILPLQGVEVVLEAIRELKECKHIFFDIIGTIPDKYNKPHQTNVRYTPWLEQRELAERIANADLCLAGHFSADIEKAKRTIPGKAYIYEMMGKVMILGDNVANRELYREDHNHIFVSMGNSKLLADKIYDCYRSFENGEVS